MRAIVPNTNYFKPVILKLKTFIYNSNSKIIYDFCTNVGNTPPVGGGITCIITELTIETFYCWYFQK